jgi:AcrR family transcriptional regulator
MDMPQGTKRRLSAADWAQAALTAIGESGLQGVAVEPIAATLGTTKGSFYWHFANRDALVVAALELWERTYTEDVLALVDQEPDPLARLRKLFAAVTQAERAPVEVNLHAAADHPLLAPAVRRAVARRTAHTEHQLTLIGLPPAEAHRRALLAYALYLGHIQVVVRLSGLIPEDKAERDAYLQSALDLVLARGPDGPASR